MKIISKYSITALLFILIIGFIGVLTLFNTAIPIAKELISSSQIPEKIDFVENIYKSDLFGLNKFIDIYSKTQVYMGTQLFDDPEFGFIIKDNQGKLHFPCAVYDTTPQFKNITEFVQKLDTKFAYIQAPSKNLEGYTTLPIGAYHYGNENTDRFLAQLSTASINYFDLREEIKKDNLECSNLFYTSDHHWTTETAFWAFGKIVNYLNENFNLNIDQNKFYTDLNNWKTTDYPQSFMGALGVRVGESISTLDDFTLIEPNFETDYEIYYPSNNPNSPTWSGTFRETIVRDEILNSKDIHDNKYSSYFKYEYNNLIIKNNKINNDLKLLIIKDSFALPVVAYLSTCIEEIHIIDLRAKGAPNPSEYVQKHDFDTILMLYNTDVFAGGKLFDLN